MKHPIDRVKWVHRDKLKANDYNPNHVAKPEMKLLKLSLIEDGFTQPIVITQDNIIIDGFHRWQLSSSKELMERDEGMVPCVKLVKSLENRMLSTIRHNRARGVHSILSMGKISHHLQDSGLTDEEIMKRLGMEKEELGRLTDNVTMFEGHGDGNFGKSWLPVFEEDGKDVEEAGAEGIL